MSRGGAGAMAVSRTRYAKTRFRPAKASASGCSDSERTRCGGIFASIKDLDYDNDNDRDVTGVS